MAATNEQLEERLTCVERELAELRNRKVAAEDSPVNGVAPWLKELAATVVHDDVYAEVARLGAEIRAKERGTGQ